MTPPDLTSTIVIDGATGKSIPATAARLDTSAIDRANPRPQAAPQAPIQAPPVPQQMAQARPQPQAREPAPPGNVVTTDKPPLSARDNAFVRNVIQRQSEGRNVSAIDAQLASDMINPKWTKFDETWMTDGRGNFRRAPRSEITIEGTRYGTDLKPIVGKMANEGFLKGDSKEIQALNHLVRTGQITQDEAANVAAGHAITVGDQVIFQTPVGIAQLSRQQFAASQGQASPSPTGQGQAPAAAPQRTAGAPTQRAPTQAAPVQQPPSVPGMIPIGSKPPKEVKPPAEHMTNANTHANRMEHAEEMLQQAEQTGLSQKDVMLGKLPLDIGRYGQSDDYKRFDRAQNAFITGKLRKESGAAINKDEYVRYQKEFIPLPNDTPDVLADKRRARAIAIQTMKDEAGAGYKKMMPEELDAHDKTVAEKAKNDISSIKKKYGL